MVDLTGTQPVEREGERGARGAWGRASYVLVSDLCALLAMSRGDLVAFRPKHWRERCQFGHGPTGEAWAVADLSEIVAALAVGGRPVEAGRLMDWLRPAPAAGWAQRWEEAHA
jgi:hypothetical protein